MEKELVVSEYSHESCLPCELNELLIRKKKRRIDNNLDCKVGLKKDILAVQLNRGFFICVKNLVLMINTIEIFPQLDGTHSISELIFEPRIESALQQLHYYNLLSFGSNEGKLIVATVGPEYIGKYQSGDFVSFSMVPLTVELYISDTCNFTCIHCMQDSKPIDRFNTGNNLSTEEILGIINQCGQLGVPNLIFMGGEPLAHPDFFKFVRYAKEIGISNLRTSTNGWLIDNNMAEYLSNFFDSIQISLHGASSSIHDYIVGKVGAWDQVSRAVKFLKENDIKVLISFTVMRENVDDIKKMPYLMKEWGVDSLRFLRLVRDGRGALLEGWSEEEIANIGNQIKDIYQVFGSTLKVDVGGFPPLIPIKNDASFYGCDAGKTLVCIASDGGVKACGSICGNDIGHIRENSLLDIWHSPKFIDIRRRTDCEDCNYRSICWGPCKVTS